MVSVDYYFSLTLNHIFLFICISCNLGSHSDSFGGCVSDSEDQLSSRGMLLFAGAGSVLTPGFILCFGEQSLEGAECFPTAFQVNEMKLLTVDLVAECS